MFPAGKLSRARRVENYTRLCPRAFSAIAIIPARRPVVRIENSFLPLARDTLERYSLFSRQIFLAILRRAARAQRRSKGGAMETYLRTSGRSVKGALNNFTASNFVVMNDHRVCWNCIAFLG